VDTFAVYLRPRGSLHSDVHSGTLFGAVCWAIQTLDLADLPAMLAGFNADPAFVLSSALPYLSSGGRRVHFYPCPALPPLTSAQVQQLADQEVRKRGGNPKDAKWHVIERAKRFKQVRYVSEALLRDVVTGQADSEALLRRWKKVGSRPDDVEYTEHMLLTTAERDSLGITGRARSLMQEEDVQRNQIDRVTGATVEGLLFFERQTFLRRGLTGLWFLLRTRDRDLMEGAFRYLKDTGIGGRRSTGKGQFDIEISSPPALPQVDQPNAFLVLSFYLPREGDWDARGEPLSYRLINFRGKHESRKPTSLADGQRTQPVYKELVRPFASGSIFPLQERRPWYGQIVRVGQVGEREVWQNGMALPVFARIGGEA
jgi:CRISPR-associated protein Csm4